ncbi:hypothetical protein D3C83_174350 [compost metagenome]
MNWRWTARYLPVGLASSAPAAAYSEASPKTVMSLKTKRTSGLAAIMASTSGAISLQ